jgi:ABC-type nitrate/sulfonate/bicarbonate transport system substrate-binding protein
MVDLVDLAKDKIPSVSAGLWVTQSYLDGHRDVVANVVDAVVEALHREKSDRAYAESEIKKHLGITDKDELDFTYDYYVNELLAPEPMPDVAQIKGDVDALVASNPKVKTIDMAGMIDRSFVEQAVKRQAAQ